MKNGLFNPHRIEIPNHLVLVPQFWDKLYYKQLKEKASNCIDFFLSDLLVFGDHSVLVGFMGYPHILTILEFISDVREKEIYFLGTAGSLNNAFDHPMPLSVAEIHSSAILDHLGPQLSYPLKPLEAPGMRPAKGVTVDIIQRETPQWLNQQVKKGMDFVEMELFPLRIYLEKAFTAVVVTSDLLTETGIDVFPDKKRLKKEFVNAFEVIINVIASPPDF